MKNAPSRADWRVPGQGLHSVKFVVFQKDRSRATLNYILVSVFWWCFILVARWRFAPSLAILFKTRPQRKEKIWLVGSAVPCAPLSDNERVPVHEDGAHGFLLGAASSPEGVTRPTMPYYFLALGAGFEKDCQ